MDYRKAVKMAEAVGTASISEVADVIMAAYEAGRAKPIELEPRRCEPAHNIDHVSMADLAEFCRITGRVIVSKEELARMMADRAIVDFMASLADGAIYAATFSRSNICLTLLENCGSQTFRECVKSAIKAATGKTPDAEPHDHCQRWLMQNALAWPKSCQTCKFGPCVHGIDKVKK